MNALCAAGFLRKKKEKFSNTPLTFRFLVKGNPDYMAGLMHQVSLWKTWSTLTEAVRTGSAVVGRDSVNYTSDSLGSEFDLVFLPAIIHSNSPRTNKILLKSSAKCPPDPLAPFLRLPSR